MENILDNPFQRFGIAHLSPSTANLFAKAPASFVMTKIFGFRGQVGAAAFRGTAVESGIAHGLVNGAETSECVDLARKEFARLSAFSTDPKKEAEQGYISDMVKIGLGELRPYGRPTSTQGAVRVDVDGLSVPIIGYYDFMWADHGIIVDLKTSSRLTSKVESAHARQVSLYSRAMNTKDARICYVTPKKSAVYTVENLDGHFSSLVQISLAMQSFLSKAQTKEEVASMIVPDIDSFYYNDPLQRQRAFEIWGI